MFERYGVEVRTLQVVVEVHLQKFEHDTDVSQMGEGLVGANEIMTVRALHSQPGQNLDFDLTLFRV